MRNKLISWLSIFKTALRSCFLGANVASLRLISHPRKFYYYCNACLFVRDTCYEFRGLPQRNLWDVLPELVDGTAVNFPSLSESWLWNDPSFPLDLLALAMICRAIRPSRVFEIGTYTGYTSLLFATNSEPYAQVFTLDLPAAAQIVTDTPLTPSDLILVGQGQSQIPCFAQHEAGKRITRLWGDSASFDFSPYYDTVDLFFVDGAHTYEYARKDTESASKCVRPNGVIAWHDYGRSGLSRGVRRWLDEFGRQCEVISCPGSSIALMRCTPTNLARARAFLGVEKSAMQGTPAIQ